MSISTASLPSPRAGRLAGASLRGARSRIGVEAGESWIRLAQCWVKGGRHGWQTAAFQISAPVRKGSRAAGRARLRAAGIRGTEAVCALNSPYVDVFPLTLEPRPAEALEAQIVARAGEQLSYPPGEAVLDYALLPQAALRPGGEGATVLVFAAPRRVVGALLESLESIGLSVGRLLTPACALAPHFATEPGSRGLAVCTGDEATSVAVIQDHEVLIERILPWGLGRLAELLSAELGLPAAQCRRLLTRAQGQPGAADSDEPVQAQRHPASPDSEEGGKEAGTSAPGAARSLATPEPFDCAVEHILGPALQELAQEAAACLGYCDSFLQHIPAKSVILTGPLAHLAPMHQLIENELGLHAGPAGPVLPGFTEGGEALGHAVAACCALWPGEGGAR